MSNGNGTDEEKQKILPDSSEDVEAAERNEDEGGSIVALPEIGVETEDEENEKDGEESGGNPSRMRLRVEAVFRAIRLCPCVVHQCMGHSRSCRICRPTKNYKTLEEDYYKGDFSENLGVQIIPFYLGSAEIKDKCPIMANKLMTALSVIKAISTQVNTLDHYRFSIIEFWHEFGAERIVEDHELIHDLRMKQLNSKYYFLFVYLRDLDKFEFIKNKELFFIDPETARLQNSNKKKRKDPWLIQVRDPFLSKLYDPFAALPELSSAETTPEKATDIADVPEPVVSIHNQGDIVQFSKSQAPTPAETTQSTPPKVPSKNSPIILVHPAPGPSGFQNVTPKKQTPSPSSSDQSSHLRPSPQRSHSSSPALEVLRPEKQTPSPSRSDQSSHLRPSPQRSHSSSPALEVLRPEKQTPSPSRSDQSSHIRPSPQRSHSRGSSTLEVPKSKTPSPSRFDQYPHLRPSPQRSHSRSPALRLLPPVDPTIQDDPEYKDSLVNPIFCGTVYVKQGDRDMTLAEVKRLNNQKEKARWSKRYLLLRNRKLYYVDDHENMLKFYYMDDQCFEEWLEKEKTKKENAILQLIGPMSDYEVYTSTKAKIHHNAPYGGNIYLRNGGSTKKPFKIIFCPKPKPPSKKGSKNEGEVDPTNKGKKLWVTALRLAKHGIKIKENYENYVADLEDYVFMLKYTNNPRVAMDFTEGTGRIVHDNNEIEKIRRESKHAGKHERFERYEKFSKDALGHGRHLTQKYYHGDIKRPEAERLLQEFNKEGSWLLRDSYARTNCLTISYLFNKRVHHKYISAASYKDPSTGALIYVATLDQYLAFYDVHSLTEFYRLNKGDTMMCMLGTSVKNESQRDSSPERSISDHEPQLINLKGRDTNPTQPQSIDNSNNSKSSKSVIKDFVSKSIEKFKPKKLATGDQCQGPSTSKEPGPSAAPARQEEPLEPPPSPSHEPSSSAISSNGAQTTPESPPPSSSEGLPPQV